jgi:hypothetical protein
MTSACGAPLPGGGNCQRPLNTGTCPDHGRTGEQPSTSSWYQPGGPGVGPPDDPTLTSQQRHDAARQVLVDVLRIMAPYREALTVVGAQAVYLRTGQVDLTDEAFTVDGDFAVDPDVIARTDADKGLGELLKTANLDLESDSRGNVMPGKWQKVLPETLQVVKIDLMVAQLVGEHGPGKAGRRSYRPGPPHGKNDLRLAYGIEACHVDRDLLPIDAPDGTSVHAYVASGAALLVAKAHKIHDRTAGPQRRQSNKDALDACRVMRTHDPDEVADRLRFVIAEHPHLSPSVTEGADRIIDLFRDDSAAGTRLLTAAMVEQPDPADIIDAAVEWAARFDAAWRDHQSGM